MKETSAKGEIKERKMGSERVAIEERIHTEK